MQNVRVTASPILKTQMRTSDSRRQLLLAVRIYRNSSLIDRLNFYVNDLGQPLYLLPSELRDGAVVNHDRAIRYTALIRFIRKTFQETAEKELAAKTTLNRTLLRDLVNNAVNTDFDLEFADDINRQLVTFDGSGYNKYNKITVDKRAMEAVANMEIPTEPTVDPLGQVELNDVDAGDIEQMIIDEDERLNAETKAIRISKLDTPTRYKRGLYNKTNIFELFASIYYDESFSETYDKIVIRLFEFRHFVKPKEETMYFNESWVTSFFEYLWRDGYTNLSTKVFDPLKFNPAIFDNKEKRKYDVDNYYKLLEIVQTVSNRFISDGLLSPVDFAKVDLFKICDAKKSRKGKRVKHNINNDEFNRLFFYEFNPKRLRSYQETFSKMYDKSTIKISIADLAVARDMFCLQTMAGGLRGYKELASLKFSKGDQHLSFYMKKIDYWMINPLNVYTKRIAEKYKYETPKLKFLNSENTLEHIYRALVKTVAEIVGFEREIIYKGKTVSVKELFKPYFCRKTFSQIMYDKYNFTLENIAMFTGHSFERQNKSVLLTNYIDTESPEKKRKLFNLIKVPKWVKKKN